jgi:hypothetical protein
VEAFVANDDDTHTRGAVKDPEHDGRLKENRESGVSKGTTHGSSHSQASGRESDNDERSGEERRSGGGAQASHSGGSHSTETHGHTPGAVRDPEHDGRLKENRERGIHKSDT